MTAPIRLMGAKVERVYRAAFDGAAIAASPETVERLRHDPKVAAIEPDVAMHVEPAVPSTKRPNPSPRWTQYSATWGIDRTDQRQLPLSNSYSYASSGVGVTAYVIDTGLRADHVQFRGRVGAGYSAIGGGTSDCVGHGTHVAGTIAGTTYGLAKSVVVRPVRIFDCSGSGSASDAIAGIDWVIGNHRAGTPAVANMSFGFTVVVPSVDAAVQSLINDGVTTSISAGNGGDDGYADDACGVTPAHVSAALTVAATDSSDYSPDWSNFGSCLDLFGPGVDVTSAWNSSSTATETISGTSMAAPHVTGAAAVLLSRHPTWTPAQVASSLKHDATTGVVTNGGPSSPNRLLYVYAPPPPNNTFAKATPFSLLGTSPLHGTNLGADRQAGEPLHAGAVGGVSVWWVFTAGRGATVTLSTQGSAFDTLLGVYVGHPVSALTPVASNDDDGTNRWSRVSFHVVAGQTYWVAVDGYHAARGVITLKFARS
ncbi:MAG: serine protease [Acidimicrobiales bacterium]|nr:serine protease [Acidimicrobiales bacterium]